jgi:hypothetical protein
MEKSHKTREKEIDWNEKEKRKDVDIEVGVVIRWPKEGKAKKKMKKKKKRKTQKNWTIRTTVKTPQIVQSKRRRDIERRYTASSCQNR